MKCLNQICPPTSTEEGTPIPSSGSHLSSTVNLSREYALALHTNSYSEIWSRIHSFNPDHQQAEIFNENANANAELLSQLLQPNREHIEQTLRDSKPNNLVTDYFAHSENTSNLCIVLFHRVHQARALYAPLHKLLDELPQNSLNQCQCDIAFDVFLQFDHVENPFPSPADSDNRFFNEMRGCFTQLKQQLDRRLQNSRSRIRVLQCATAGSVICIVGAIAVSTAVIATHALAGILVLLPFCGPKKREIARMAQLEAAAKGVYVLNNDLDTIDRLVERLRGVVEGDKELVRLGLERGREMYAISEVVKQLRKNHGSVVEQLKGLEEHICLCFGAINKARSLLLGTIHVTS